MEKLTQQEEEAMQVIWQLNGGFIKDFLEKLPDPQPPYTTLASTVKNLEKKGYLVSEKLGNTYRYTPLIKAEDYKKRFMKGFVGDYFKDSYKELVAFFAKEQQISAEELKEIIDMIENKKSE
ncbi:BlaI/MecI/CopY family transcriptional regulator [Pontibacter sp. SGAir0037]|uniref:BlaI/MecI/CopY family transcriptional regulator n=1 Tax=Pontibacter sp. SGAir0037 TaxID=2571030 RepID=UPI0010CD05D2|nr:BlaI/MecI/CopY family transcriptional regulator [Pontibacter sp. SGAir0037]QCR23401.1 transcriptional regulator [Pontibacter sp. SGAir0037]